MSNDRNDEIRNFAAVFRALANPSRLSIFMRLVNCCAPGTLCSTDSTDVSTCVGEVAQGLQLAPSTVSHHLKELRQAGLIQMAREGQKFMCRVNPEVFDKIQNFLRAEPSEIEILE